jgi:aarF domain-containing kinase
VHSLLHTKRVVERVFHRPFDEIFEEFDEVPIGSGAIAQVYRATLRKDLIPPSYHNPRRTRKPLSDTVGPVILQDPPPAAPTASVAIKVLHPRVSQIISRDLSIMNFFATCISVLPGMQWLSLPEEVDVFGHMMYQQLDLRNEADNLLTFEQNFAPRKVPITFPRPLKLWSSADMLVEEFENALPLELFLRKGGGPYDYQVATIGLNAFLASLFIIPPFKPL